MTQAGATAVFTEAANKFSPPKMTTSMCLWTNKEALFNDAVFIVVK